MFMELNQNDLLLIDGGGWLKDLVDDIPYAYDAIIEFLLGFADGLEG